MEFVKAHLSFTGEDSPMASLMVSVMGAIAEFERALIHEWRREGIALAKQRGAYRGSSTGTPSTGVSKAQIAREFGVSRKTLYQYLNKRWEGEDALFGVDSRPLLCMNTIHF